MPSPEPQPNAEVTPRRVSGSVKSTTATHLPPELPHYGRSGRLISHLAIGSLRQRVVPGAHPFDPLAATGWWRHGPVSEQFFAPYTLPELLQPCTKSPGLSKASHSKPDNLVAGGSIHIVRKTRAAVVRCACSRTGAILVFAKYRIRRIVTISHSFAMVYSSVIHRIMTG
jgi:hypothetical protein